MRRDVKRSLVAWPLAASVVTMLLCYGSVQSNLSGEQLLARIVGEITRFAAQGDPSQTTVAKRDRATPVRTVTGGESSKPSKRNRIADRGYHLDDLSRIEDWLDVSLKVSTNPVVGIPAPKLNTQSDLFGFELNPSATPDRESDLRIDATDDAAFELDRDIFFAEDGPLNSQEPVLVLESASPQLAERPTIDVALPSTFEAPAPIVADLAPEVAPGAADGSVVTAAVERRKEDHASPKNLPSAADSIGRMPDATGNVTDTVPEDSVNKDVKLTLRSLSQPRSATWPVAPRLNEQLDILERITDRIAVSVDGSDARMASAGKQGATKREISLWLDEVRGLLQHLPSLNRLGEPEVADVVNRLAALQQRGAQRAEQLSSRGQRVAWLQAAYAIERRLAVWRPIYEINSGDFPTSVHVGDDTLSVTATIDRLNALLPETGDAQGWQTFLLLNPLRKSFASGNNRDRRELSQTFLSRIYWPNLHPVHRQWLQNEAVMDVAEAVRPWASGAIDYAALLRQIEKAESNAIDLVTAEVAQSMQALQHAGHPKAKQLAQNLDAHYRNANIRFSISDAMLEKLLPELPARQVPVSTTLLGSRVTGVSRVTSDLKLRIYPSSSSWKLTLETLGNVATRSVGRRGPAAVSTSSVNPFVAATPIQIHKDDVSLGDPSVDVAGRTRLRGIATRYDDWPLIGELVRSLAENEYFETSPLTERIARQRMRSELVDEIDRTLHQKVDDATVRFSDAVLGPLTRLQLDPQVIDMQSTDTRLIARYRMAGPWQLAAMTPRPRALTDNLFSLQVHQSALNNTLEQLVPQDELMPIENVLSQCFALLGVQDQALPDDMPTDISIQFARHRPITVEVEQGRVWITMRIIRLDRSDRMHLRNFIVRAAYRPNIDGLSASLVRDGHLSISGPGMSMRQRLPLRAVFNKVLSPTRPLNLISGERLAERCPQGTGISQFELRDGWVGISVGPIRENQAIASRPAGIR